ncbi:hypothetical protein J2Y38_004048, partial [Flavobacterium sp. 2755]|nr:hypothetical protein [Flavobacterium sp. 2755]
MSKSFKIKKDSVVTLLMVFWSIISYAGEFNPIFTSKNRDSINVAEKNVSFGPITYTKCFDGVFDENDETVGANGLRPKPGSITYINTNGQTVSLNNIWSGNPVTITYRSISSQLNLAACCTGSVTAQLTSTAGTDVQTKCTGTAITNITYSSTGGTSADFSGLPPGVTGSYISNIVTISGTPTTPGTFNYTVTVYNDCIQANLSGSITVNGSSFYLDSSAGIDNQTKCINTAIIPIPYNTSGVTGVSYSGLPSGVTGNFANNVVTISGTPTVAGSFPYTVTFSGSCGNANATGTIIVTPAKIAGVASSSPTLCINTALTPITHTTSSATGISPAGTPPNYGLPTGISASWASNTITISGTPTTAGTFNYSIPLAGTCGTANATGTIIVKPNNTAGGPSYSPTICINTTIVDETAIKHTTTGATAIGTATGLPVGITAAWASNTITISGTPTIAGTFNYSIPLAGGCGIVNATGTIIVTPVKTAGTASSSPTLCINTALTAITHTTTNVTGISNSGVSGANGLPAGVSAAWASNTITISGTPTASGTFNYSIPLTGGCGTVNATGTIIVTQANTVSA